MGHVVERHSLEQVIEGSAIAIAISMAFGDVSWLADMGVGVGSFLITSFYSRSHEAEADQFAYQHSLLSGINPKSLGLILTRMEQDMDGLSCDKTDTKACSKQSDLGQNEDDGKLLGYFSTHPSSQERTKMGKRYQTCFEKGLTICSKSNDKMVKENI
jgi:Zn-dependent protease with chaperone function